MLLRLTAQHIEIASSIHMTNAARCAAGKYEAHGEVHHLYQVSASTAWFGRVLRNCHIMHNDVVSRVACESTCVSVPVSAV